MLSNASPIDVSAKVHTRSPHTRTVYRLPVMCPKLQPPPSWFGPPNDAKAEELPCSVSQKMPRRFFGNEEPPTSTGIGEALSVTSQGFGLPMGPIVSKPTHFDNLLSCRSSRGPALTCTVPFASWSPPSARSMGAPPELSNVCNDTTASPKKSSLSKKSWSNTRICTSGWLMCAVLMAKPKFHAGFTPEAVWLRRPADRIFSDHGSFGLPTRTTQYGSLPAMSPLRSPFALQTMMAVGFSPGSPAGRSPSFKYAAFEQQFPMASTPRQSTPSTNVA
mmetsp:Transcript_49929/g.145213  ORF Transcript_49929/g.145213 Transcript_49929/m.145213 type:complete len:276 (+) Transcript_49929:686-1513(+)